MIDIAGGATCCRNCRFHQAAIDGSSRGCPCADAAPDVILASWCGKDRRRAGSASARAGRDTTRRPGNAASSRFSRRDPCSPARRPQRRARCVVAAHAGILRRSRRVGKGALRAVPKPLLSTLMVGTFALPTPTRWPATFFSTPPSSVVEQPRVALVDFATSRDPTNSLRPASCRGAEAHGSAVVVPRQSRVGEAGNTRSLTAPPRPSYALPKPASFLSEFLVLAFRQITRTLPRQGGWWRWPDTGDRRGADLEGRSLCA